ncbi:siderophore-interacting protein [Variovorax ginsengisoli]|uniref:NADPH-dependent ferric siderophore reductase n=1 Tax=Variovorax ginsengisoli TaxID=363844 RepID=A0ABT9SBY8_9BURK|nr:siderophore-interacting protein [Variovorax ginsengisoli]MDP9901429.1 NADPH-dependent ferric siderophore reductase [Variovorax ginsengisoli]
MNTPLASHTEADRTPQRVRHTLRFRVLDVLRVQRVTPHLVRVTLGGDDLEGFHSPGFDDHAKLFFPDPQTGELTVPTAGPDGPVWPEGRKPVMRDYTPRHFDAAARTLDIDFALHEAGPATRWAEQATPGQRLGVGGPRGSFIVPTNFDWHLLIGDDTALPAIARRLAELPADGRALVIVEVDGAADQVPLPSPAAQVEVVWVHRGSIAADPAAESPLLQALRRKQLPTGAFHAWIGCESAAAKALRAHLVNECKANPKWVRASGYWRRGTAATHDSHDE